MYCSPMILLEWWETVAKSTMHIILFEFELTLNDVSGFELLTLVCGLLAPSLCELVLSCFYLI